MRNRRGNEGARSHGGVNTNARIKRRLAALRDWLDFKSASFMDFAIGDGYFMVFMFFFFFLSYALKTRVIYDDILS